MRARRQGLPSKEELLRHLAEAPEEITRRDLARAFGLKGQERADLRAMMRELEADGLLARGHKKRVRPKERLPGVAVVEVVSMDEDGDLLAVPSSNEAVSVQDGGLDPPGPLVRLLTEGRGRAPKIGDRVLARLSHLDEQRYDGRVIKILPRTPSKLIGILERTRNELMVRSLDRRDGRSLRLDQAAQGDAAPGDLVVIEGTDDRPLDRGTVKITERLGQIDDAGAISLLSAHQHDLRMAFPPEVIEAADEAKPVGLGKRKDLRHLPLITIDGSDARDFDDAVFAEPDQDPNNPGGWMITVAIADVAHYVRPGTPLDVEARNRGNSTYFPDRVLPMLPEALSNGLCSLRPGEDRACLAVHIQLDRKGTSKKHRFERGLMRSAARLTYQQVQEARNRRPDEQTAPLMDKVISPLYGAFSALVDARRRRGTLDLDLPELRIMLDERRRPVDVGRTERLDAHRLIEEFMIAANVAAAETLENKAAACMYRVHDKPDPVKLEGLGQLLKSLGIVKQGVMNARPKDLSRLLEKTRDHPLSPLVSSLLLRAQNQAVYSPVNIGHYGLNLGRYAHFTSPIRRYADLLVHRSLIAALRLGDGGFVDDVDVDAFRDLGARISANERKSMEAERSAKDRFIAALMAERIGATFQGRITSVHRFGLFVRLDDSLADALVPISSMSARRLEHEDAQHALIERETGTVWSLGDAVEVELVEVDTAMGRLSCRLTDHTPGPRAANILKSRRRSKKPEARGRRRRR